MVILFLQKNLSIVWACAGQLTVMEIPYTDFVAELSMGRLDQARTRKCKPEPRNNLKV